MVRPAVKVAEPTDAVQVLVRAAGPALTAPPAVQVAVQVAELQVAVPVAELQVAVPVAELQVGRQVVASKVPTTARPSGS